MLPSNMVLPFLLVNIPATSADVDVVVEFLENIKSYSKITSCCGTGAIKIKTPFTTNGSIYSNNVHVHTKEDILSRLEAVSEKSATGCDARSNRCHKVCSSNSPPLL